MLKTLRSKEIGVRIRLAVVVGMLGVGMLLYLIPGQGSMTGSSSDVVAEVAGQPITALEVRQQLQRIESRGAIPRALESLYIQQILNQLVYQQMLEAEAKRLGIRVTAEERADRIRQLIPNAFIGDTFVGMEQYSAAVQLRTGMTVPEFEELVRQGLLEEKFRQLVTDGITVTPEEVQQEFRRRNEKVKLDYVVIKPDELEAKVPLTDADLASFFEKNKAGYILPERRVVRYALLDVSQLRQRANVTDEELRAYYNDHIDRYKIPDRVHVAHILFKTVGKTDAEIAEIQKKAEGVLKKAKQGGNFAELAKQYSDDTSKDKGGDIGWIVRGQTVPEFEAAAFSLPKGAISDLVKTEYGFHIIKILDRETAHTQSFDEVKASILPILAEQKTQQLADNLSNQIADQIRRQGRPSLEDLAKKYNLALGETKPLSATDSTPELGNAPTLLDAIFSLRPGDVSMPVRTDRGYVVLSVKEVQPSHQATLAEVRDKVAADYRKEKAVELARARAEELAKRGQSGEDFSAAAKALGFEVKNSDPFARTGTLPDVGSARQLAAAFSLPVGQTGPPVFLGSNWVVYRVVAKEEPTPEDFAKQRSDIEQQVLQSKRGLAYDIFRSALETRFRNEGKLRYMPDALKRLTSSG